MAFLELSGVTKTFGVGAARVEVLRNVQLAVEQGEFVAILGPSGAGKTTLLSLIAGLLTADTGSIRLNGRELTRPGPERGVVFQNYSLLPWLTVEQNVALAVDQVFAHWPSERRRAHTLHYVRLVNLSAARDKRPAQLSGGMRQRVAVARALAMEPDVLLLDEPLSALDALTRATLQDEIERIWERERKTVVLVTNDVDEGLRLADRVVLLSAGPGATLGRAISVDLPRPRERRALNHDPAFARLRSHLIEHLLAAQGRPSTTGTAVPGAATPRAVEVGA
jgi:nitrate/nitrite transport system ATP-binding protein